MRRFTFSVISLVIVASGIVTLHNGADGVPFEQWLEHTLNTAPTKEENKTGKEREQGETFRAGKVGFVKDYAYLCHQIYSPQNHHNDYGK